MSIERTDIANQEFAGRNFDEQARATYINSLLERNNYLLQVNALLLSQVEELLPWAKIGAQRGVTDSTWDEAQALLRRIIRGEFDIK